MMSGMESEIIQTLTRDFESFVNKTDDDFEYWLARDLQKLLGYGKWENFQNVLTKAKTTCEVSGQKVEDHFPDVGKTIKMPKGASKEVQDYMLTRYACYLIAQNGDPRKKEIAFAQTYFAIQTRKAEIIEQRILETERLSARSKLAQTEKELSGVIFEQTKDNRNFAFIRSKGDKALFNLATKDMKKKLKVPKNRALADFLPTILLKAKDFATEITIFNAKKNNLKTEHQFSSEHITNNKRVRKTLIDRGIKPETLPPAEDVKKVERRLKSERKESLE